MSSPSSERNESMAEDKHFESTGSLADTAAFARTGSLPDETDETDTAAFARWGSKLGKVRDPNALLEGEGEEADPEFLENETWEKPKTFLRPRRGGVCADPIVTGYYKEPYWNKQENWDAALFSIIKHRPVFEGFGASELRGLVRVMSSHFYYAGETVFYQGDRGDDMLIVLQGSVDCYQNVIGQKDRKHIRRLAGNAVIDEINLVWMSPRAFTAVAAEECIFVRLTRDHFMNAIVRVNVYRWWSRQSFLRGASLLEMMEDEPIAKLVDVLKGRSYEPGALIVRQGDVGNSFFILHSGEARCWVSQNGDEQEYRRYRTGELFGELALLMQRPRAANISAVTKCECLVLTRGQFERMLGPMAGMHQQQYLTDPRKLIAEFYGPSDDRGPLGTLALQGLEPDPSRGQSSWFVVYRPTSKDAIAKMLSGNAVGKGLNVKGKSAKQGVLSGFVPFIQISDNKHKSMIEQSPATARLTIYYKTKAAREAARGSLQHVLDTAQEVKIQTRVIEDVDDYDPKVFGLNIPEPLCREAYIMRPDLSPVMGWEVGRRSEPAFMDMNLHAVRDVSEPKVVLYQYDESDSMNPRGLLIAYAEQFCKPVVSDFDTFVVASRGMQYSCLPQEQMQLMMWGLGHTESILNSLDHNPWTTRWLDVLKKENERGFHPKFPKYGYGDDTSYKFIADIVEVCKGSGAVRHGAECFNFYFPQELDDEYLVIWEGYPDKPWEYLSEKQMREFLLERVADGYAFPINPVWPIRDKGWDEVLQALLNSSQAPILKAWYPDASGILQKIMELKQYHPDGFQMSADKAAAATRQKSKEPVGSSSFTKKGPLSQPTHEGYPGEEVNTDQMLRQISSRSAERAARKSQNAELEQATKKSDLEKRKTSSACCIQ